MAGKAKKLGGWIDWFIRGHYLVTILISFAGGGVAHWLVAKYFTLPLSLAVALWCLVTAGLILLIEKVLKRRGKTPSTAIVQTLNSGDLATALAATDTFYKTCGGPMLDEVEEHMRKLAFHHTDPAEREQFLIRTLSAGGLAYLFDVASLTIYRSQLEALIEINGKGFVNISTLRPFYENAAREYPERYKARSFESWLSWMRTQILMKQEGDFVIITIRGIDFLKYLVQSGVSPKDRLY